jgi:hypothetical protein
MSAPSDSRQTRQVPSVDDEAAAGLRVSAIRMMLRRHGGDMSSWPEAARATYSQLILDQAEYERLHRRGGDG